MKNIEFTKHISDQIKKCEEVLIVKGGEYATEDRLHNFRNAKTLLNSTMEQALAGFMGKHTVSIYDMISSDDAFPLDKWDEKITDHINYLLILAAVVRDGNKFDGSSGVLEKKYKGMVEDNKKSLDHNRLNHDDLECLKKYMNFISGNVDPAYDYDGIHEKINTLYRKLKIIIESEA